MPNHPLLSITSQDLDNDTRKRFVARGVALFRSLEAMPWPLFAHDTVEKPGMAKADRATLMEYGIHDTDSLIERMIRLYDDSLSYMLSGSVDPCVCSDFMRKAVALVPEIGDLHFRTEKLLRVVKSEPDYTAEVIDLFDTHTSLEAVLNHIDNDSYTSFYREAYDFFYARYAFGNGVEKSELLADSEDMDTMILHSVNDYWREKMKDAAYQRVKDRCDFFGCDADDLDDSDDLEQQIVEQLAEDDRLDEYDLEIDWERLQSAKSYTDDQIEAFKFNIAEARAFVAERAKEFADAEEQRRADAERRSMPETAA